MSLPDSDNEVTARRLSAVLTGLFSKISTALNLKADKVANATNGHFAALDANGNLTDSGKNTADFATAAQGANADSAIQGVKVNGTDLSKDGNNVVDVPVPTASTATPLKDGTASAGSSSQWARGDHRHPTDDSREAVSNKKQSIDPTSTTEYGSSKAVADFVNSSVATNTANFLGTISESSLGLDYTATNEQIALALNVHSWVSIPTNNDYCFVSVNDPQTTDVDEYRRFKFNGSVWAYEYTLNNSSFTQPQWDAINSGIDSSDVAAYNAAVTLLNAHVGDSGIHVTSSEKNAWNAKQNAISDLATIRSGAAAGASALQPSGNGSNLSVTPDGTSTGTDIGSSTTLKVWAQKFKNLVGSLKSVAFSGSYSDLSNKPTIPAAQVNSDWNATSGVAQIKNKPTLATVATSGSYNDLSNKPTIPAAANNGVLTITQNGTSKGTFSANQSSNNTIALTDTTYSQISRGSGAGLAPGLPSGSGTAKYLREDGNWAEPPESLSIVSGWEFDDPIVQLSPESQYTLKVGSKRYAFETPAGSDTWKANSLSSEGYVKKGEGYYDCVWGTNSNGAPDWLALANLSVGYANNATSASNYSSGGGIDNALQGKAPKLHIDTQGIYGLAKEGYYGHVKLVKGNVSGIAYSDGEAASVGHNHDGSYLKCPQSHTLQWGGTSVIGTYNGNNITLTMPANPFNPNGDYSSNTLRANTAVIADSAKYAVGASNFTTDGSIYGRFSTIGSTIDEILTFGLDGIFGKILTFNSTPAAFNFDGAKTAGIHIFNLNADVSGGPASGHNVLIVLPNASGNRVWQISLAYGILVRKWKGSSWSSWKTILSAF